MADSTSGVRVRFAPSPTGKLHIGGARTAIYNWAFARATGGTFVLRIEDTDPERSTEENTQIILRAMRWLGLDWDEGPEVGGDFGPYKQTERFDTYKAALEQLKERGAVYPCFCTKETLDAKREAAEKTEGGYSGYDRTCRSLSAEEAQARIDAGEPHVWRLKVPENHGPIEFDDAVYGHMSFPADVMDDMILVRTDGTPTYNFAVVCDDANMHITHVIRGDDHLSNTPRQILIYEALGLEAPTFAHLSHDFGRRRQEALQAPWRHERRRIRCARLFARHDGELPGSSGVEPRRRDHDHSSRCAVREVQPRPHQREKDAVFDETKLDWMNGQYIKTMQAGEWVKLSTPWLAQARAAGMAAAEGAVVVDAAEAEPFALSDDEQAAAVAETAADIEARPAFYEALYPLLAERETSLSDAADEVAVHVLGQKRRARAPRA